MYGALVYLRFAFKDGDTHCCFVMGKSQLAPIKTLTIPRLELNAAVIGVKLYNIITHQTELPIEKNKLWSDSMLTLQYMQDKSLDIC